MKEKKSESRKNGTSTSSSTQTDSIKSGKDQISRKDLILLIAILSLALFLRVLQIPERMVFSGETNNMLYYVESYLRGEKPILMGLEAAQYIHHLFHLPWYLWLMIPLFIFGNGNPLVFAWFHAAIGVVTTFLFWRIGSRRSHGAGVLAALIYAAWMQTITIDRFVSPVSLVPFGVITAIWLFLWGREHPSRWRFLLIGFWVGVAVSFHYVLLSLVAVFLFVSWWRYQRYALGAALGVLVAFLPLIIFDLRHQFFNLTGLWYVGRSLFDETRPYGSSHFIYQLLPFVILTGAWLFSRLPRMITASALVLFLVVQGRAFREYRVSPNFAERNAIVTDILNYWDDGVQIFFSDESSFDYGYLLRFEAKQQRLDPKKVEIYEPWQPENSAMVVVKSGHVSKRPAR